MNQRLHLSLATGQITVPLNQLVKESIALRRDYI